MARKDANRAEKLTAAERRPRVLELKKAGASVRAIARALDVGATTVQRDLDLALGELAAEQRAGAERLRVLELARLDAMHSALWPRVRAGDTDAIDRLLRIAERRSKLLGLDAPARVDITAYVRELALAEGLDPDEAVREAERIVAAEGLGR